MFRSLISPAIFIFTLLVSASSFAQSNPQMVFVKGGDFEMGDNHAAGDPDERPLHKVRLSDYYIAKTEVTVKEWRLYCKEKGIDMPPEPKWGWRDDHPIVSVTWEEANDYCKWISGKTGKPYRLPTEAEWEYAARGGVKGKNYLYSGSDKAGDVAWIMENSQSSVHPVAQKKPNELGLFDMSGNAWEWCSDHLDNYIDEDQVNPAGSTTSVFVVRRGGSWDDHAYRARSTYRIGNSPRRSYHTLGFRIAMSFKN
ncbi:MAG: formylglycine-generating enzyme family protein [Chitinophagaceae bacterium]|nr:formylglycine-generating enzyme family protein [Chitinophagaceae bacterium]